MSVILGKKICKTFILGLFCILINKYSFRGVNKKLPFSAAVIYFRPLFIFKKKFTLNLAFDIKACQIWLMSQLQLNMSEMKTEELLLWLLKVPGEPPV